MANMLAELITHELGYPTTLVANLGSTTVTHQAMLRGDADIAATRYTGTDLTGTLKMPVEKKSPKGQLDRQARFQAKVPPDLVSHIWVRRYIRVYGHQAVRCSAPRVDHQSAAAPGEGHGRGVDSSWMNRKGDGYADFKTGYGFDFKRVYPMQIGLVYDAVEAGKMQTVLGYSTDGRIKSYDLTVLKDNKHFFPPYDASLVVNDSLLKKNTPSWHQCCIGLTARSV